MPTLDQHHSRERTAVLLLGDPGSGKTTAIGHLLEHGQRLFVADFDDGLDPIRKIIDPKYHPNLIYETLTDPVRINRKGIPEVRRPVALKRYQELLKNWVDSETGEDYGPPESWGPNDWLVTDGLTFQGQAAMYFVLAQENRAGHHPRLRDWGLAIRLQEGIIQELRSLPINMLITAHLAELSSDEGEDEGESRPGVPKAASAVNHKRYPSALGKKLPPRIGAYFNTVVQTKMVGSGRSMRPVIRTVPDPDVDVKVPLPPKKLPVEVEINELFPKIILAIR